MQLFHCPFCGERPESEFHFIGEAGKIRPAPAAEVAPAAWSSYLHEAANTKGKVVEIWLHIPCGEVHLMRRDTTTMGVEGTRSFREGTPT